MPEVEELADRLIQQDQRLQREAAERLAETEERLEEISRELGKAEAREKAEEELEQAKAALAACGEKACRRSEMAKVPAGEKARSKEASGRGGPYPGRFSGLPGAGRQGTAAAEDRRGADEGKGRPAGASG